MTRSARQNSLPVVTVFLIVSVLVVLSVLLYITVSVSAAFGMMFVLVSYLSVLAAIILLLVKLFKARRKAFDKRMAQIYFQTARACGIVLVVGAVLTLLNPNPPEAPVFQFWQLLLLSIGVLGFLFGMVGYYDAGGDEKFHILLFKLLTKLTL